MPKYTTDEAILKLIENKLIKVYQDGLVYNCIKNRYYTSGSPYDNNSIAFRLEGETYAVSKTRIVWVAFNGLVPQGNVVTKKEREGKVELSNLVLITPKELAARSGMEGKQLKGENCHFARFKDNEVVELRKEYKSKPFSLRKRAKELVTNHVVLSALLTGKTYSHLPEACQIVGRGKSSIYTSEERKARKNEKDRLAMAKARKAKALIRDKAIIENRKPSEVSFELRKRQIELEEQAKKSPIQRQKDLKDAATNFLKSHSPVKLPKIKIVKEPKPKVVKETKPVVAKPVEIVVKQPVDYAAQRDKLRLQREASIERINNDRIERQLEQAKKEKASKDRLALIKAAMEKRKDQKQTSILTPFKQFTIYHLHHNLGESFEKISEIIRVPDLNIVELGFKAFKSESYETVKAELVDKHGRDSAMLTSIRLFEGDHNYEE